MFNFKELKERHKKRKCKCSHERQQHDRSITGFGYCNECPCTKFTRHDRPTTLDKVMIVVSIVFSCFFITMPLSIGLIMYDASQLDGYETETIELPVSLVLLLILIGSIILTVWFVDMMIDSTVTDYLRCKKRKNYNVIEKPDEKEKKEINDTGKSGKVRQSTEKEPSKAEKTPEEKVRESMNVCTKCGISLDEFNTKCPENHKVDTSSCSFN